MSQSVDLEPKELSVEEAKEELIGTVKELIGYPLSSWAVAATIESIGIRDIDVKPDYGYDNVFELAEFVYAEIINELESQISDKKSEPFKKNAIQNVGFFIKHYSEGLLLSLPMLLQVAAILIFEYALWAWLKFNETQATMVAIGTISAFVVTGGFIQVIGRIISKYIGEKNYYLAAKGAWNIVKLALPAIVIVGISFFVLNLAFPFYPQSIMVISLAYFGLISIMLLSASVLFATELRLMIIFSIAVGTVIVIMLMNYTNVGVYIAQWVGIIIATILMGGYGWLYYRLKIKALKQELIKQTLPKPEVTYYNNYRFFIYGFVYFLFLFMDRILAWSTGTPPPPYIIWFNTPYELGMDWALISFVVSIAVLEYCIHAFSNYLIPAQKNILVRDTKLFNKYFLRFYNWQLIVVLIVGVVSVTSTYFGVLSLRVFENQIPEIRDFFSNPLIYKVFWMGSIGYILLIYGLMNSLFFFTLNRPELVIYAITFSLFVNGITGFICSRTFGFEYATLGLVFGAFTFALTTWYLAQRFFKHLDYFYYSAY